MLKVKMPILMVKVKVFFNFTMKVKVNIVAKG